MIRPEVLDALVAAGCTAEQIAAAVKADQARSSGADRQARYRQRKASQCDESDVTPVTVTETLPPKERSPTPPKEITPNPRQTDTARSVTTEFEADFWPAFPRKVAKPQALKAYLAARKRSDREPIIAGVQRYAEERRLEDPKFTKHAATWLNADGWLDEPAPRSHSLRVVNGSASAKPRRTGDRLFDLMNPPTPSDERTIDEYARRR